MEMQRFKRVVFERGDAGWDFAKPAEETLTPRPHLSLGEFGASGQIGCWMTEKDFRPANLETRKWRAFDFRPKAQD